MAEDWEPLLTWLSVPRENGTAALHRTAERLLDWLEGAGLAAEAVPFLAHPLALRIAGAVALIGAVLYARAMRERRYGAAILLALGVPGLLWVDLEVRPLVSTVSREAQVHVQATVPARRPATQTLFVTAHYDSKTDLLDHGQRAWVEGATGPVVAWMVLGAALARRRFGRGEALRGFLVRAASPLAVLFGVASFATLSGGAFHPRPSPGALDDGAACAAAMRLAERVAADPLERTELHLLLLSGEEIGTQGARAFARERFAAPPERPTAVLNLEVLGAAPDLAYLAEERFTLRRHEASQRLVALADASHQALRKRPLQRSPGGVTDAREFLARGVPAVTLLSSAPDGVRRLHTAADRRERVDVVALDAQLAFLEDVVRRIDRDGL